MSGHADAVTSFEDSLTALGPIVRSPADSAALGMAFQIEIGPDGVRRFTFVGQRCEAVNGVPAEAVLEDASRFFELIVPEHREAFDAAVAQARATLEPFDVEVAMRLPDGKARWRRIAAMPRPQADGRVLWDGLQLDVTDRRRMATELSEQRRRLEMAAEATGLGFWEWDVTAGAVTWSERNRQLFGVRPDEPLSVQRYLSLIHPDDVEGVRQAFIAAREQPTGGDYSLEHRIVTPAGEQRWIVTTGRVQTDAEGGARLVVGTSLDITARKAAEERRSLLMGELAHRAKNGIAVMMAIVAQTARGQDTVKGFRDLLLARLEAMARSQDLVTAAGGRPVPLAEVIGSALQPFGQARFDVDPTLAEVTLRGDLAAGVGLLLHEMATNAVKYGALSNESGRVSLAVETARADRAAFRWREAGGPPVVPAGREGFGTRLLKQVLRPQGGEVKFEFEPHGFHASIEFPVAPEGRI